MESKMTKKAIAFLLSGLLGLAAYAQNSTDSRGVTESTDPSRAAAVEQHAQALRERSAPAAKSQHQPMHHKHHPMARHSKHRHTAAKKAG
jgi:DNA-binding transcriptional regulator of glucitol operon